MKPEIGSPGWKSLSQVTVNSDIPVKAQSRVARFFSAGERPGIISQKRCTSWRIQHFSIKAVTKIMFLTKRHREGCYKNVSIQNIQQASSTLKSYVIDDNAM